MTTEEYFAQLQGKLDAEMHNKSLEEPVLKSQIEQLQQHLMDCKEEYLELEAKYLVQLELNQALKTALAYSEDAAKKGDDARFAAGGMEMELESYKEFTGFAVRFNSSAWAYLPNEDYAKQISSVPGYELQKLYRKEGV